MKKNDFLTQLYHTIHIPYSDPVLALYTKAAVGLLWLLQLPFALWYHAPLSFYALLGGLLLVVGLNLLLFRNAASRTPEYLSSALLFVLCFAMFQQGSIGYFSPFFLLIFLFCNVFVLGIAGSFLYSVLGLVGVLLCLNGVLVADPAAQYGTEFLPRFPFLFVCILGIAYIIMFFIQNDWFKTRQRHVTLQKRIDAEREKLSEMSLKVITAMYSALSTKVPEIDLHCEQVAETTQELARRMGLDEASCRDGHYAGLLHEVGTVGLPDAVLQRTNLTEEQYQLYQTYVERGYQIIRQLQIVDRVAETVRYHREHYDGSGYLAGLKGDQIPLLSRILAVADFVDRHHRRGESSDEILAGLTARAGSEFDPQCVEVMKELLRSRS